MIQGFVVMGNGNFFKAYRWYGIALVTAIVTAVFQLRTIIFFQDNDELNSFPDFSNKELLITVPVVDFSGVSASSLWGMKEKESAKIETENTGDSLWDVKRETNGWVLLNKEKNDKSWLFSGVVSKQNSMIVVLYCANCDEKWQFIKEKDMFFDLLVDSVTSTTVIFKENDSVQWHIEQFAVTFEKKEEERQ